MEKTMSTQTEQIQRIEKTEVGDLPNFTDQKEKRQHILERILLLILLFFPLMRANRGIDLMDAGYSLGNFTFLSDMHISWKISTFLANVTGHVLTLLPGGDTWLGMNIYTGLLVGITAACSYGFFVKRTRRPVVIFLGELAALGLCWAPTVILYHYLTYILVTFAMMCLCKALTDPISEKQQTGWFLLAGFLLGANVLVRLPNVTQMAFIVCVWYCGCLRKKKLKQVLRETGCCLTGYVIGFGIPFGAVCLLYGPSEYVNMIGWLFGITERAEDYKPTSMVSSMFADYIQYSGWLFLIIAYVLVGVLGFQVIRMMRKNHLPERIWKILFTAGFAVLLRFCYGRGMFDFNYHSYFSIYKWVTVFLLLFIGTACYQLVFARELWIKVFSLFCIVEIFVAPLGSNNSLYSIINNMFLTAPFAFFLFAETARSCWKKDGRYYPVAAGYVLVMACVWIQSMGFAMNFALHDGMDGTPLDTKISGTGVLDGMYTTRDKAEFIEDLVEYAGQEQLAQRRVILYGDIPSVSYILHKKPAVFSTWCDLDSNSGKLLEQQLVDMTQRMQQTSERPIVIVSAAAGAYLTEDAEGLRILEEDLDRYQDDTKLQSISDFLKENDYTNTFCSQMFMVFE